MVVTTTRRALLVVSAAAAMAATAVLGAGQPALAGQAADQVAPAAGIAPEADVSHHGHVSLWGERIGVRMRSANRGPSDLPDATVRLRFSVPLTAGQALPRNCTRGGERTVLCETGALRADGEARWTTLALRTAGQPAEVVVQVDTVWNGGASDRDPGNNTHRVLAPATGDAYVF